MKAISPGDALFTKTQQKVLALLYGRPEQSFYLNEIVRHANMGRGTVNRELECMHAAGILTTKTQGNQNHYQANIACPIFAELKAIVQKTFGITETVRAALAPLWENITCAFIYGSIAKGTEKAGSDIDLMIIAEKLSYAEVMELLTAAEVELGRSIHPVLYTRKEWMKRLKEKNAFVTRITKQDKHWIKGSEHDIG